MRRLLPDPAELDDDRAGRRLPGARRAGTCGSTSSPRWTARSPSTAAAAAWARPGDRRVFRTLRALADVVLVGHGTAAAEGYGPVDRRLRRSAGCAPSLGRPPTAPIAVVSQRASLDPASRLVTGAVSPTILVTCAAADAGRRAALAAAGVVVLVCGDDEVDLPLALDRLAELRARAGALRGRPDAVPRRRWPPGWSTSWTCRSRRRWSAAGTGCSSGLPERRPAGPAPAARGGRHALRPLRRRAPGRPVADGLRPAAARPASPRR